VEPLGARYWLGQLDAGATRASVAGLIWSSREHRNLISEGRAPRVGLRTAFKLAIDAWNQAVPSQNSRPGGPLAVVRAPGKGAHRG
jgi:hypothetical protein